MTMSDGWYGACPASTRAKSAIGAKLLITMPADRGSAMHPSGSARSGPPPDRPVGSAPPPPPRWRNWLLFAGILLTAALFLVPIPTSSKVEQLSYSQLNSDIAAGQVASVALSPDGSVSGQLTNQTKFTSSYPVTLQDPQFAQLLDQHNVQVTAPPAQTSIWSVLLNLLPLAVIVALWVWSVPGQGV
jgi:cell division protease FtsH